MNISIFRRLTGLSVFFALSLSVSALTALSQTDNTTDADERSALSHDSEGDHSDKNDRVQIFGSNQIAADEKITGDAVAVMGSNTVDGAVSHDVVAVMGSSTVNGSVGHDAVAVMGQAVINGTVGHNAVAVMGDMTLGPDAIVRGDVVIVGGTLHRAPTAVVRGRIVNQSSGFFSFHSNRRFGSWTPGPDWRHMPAGIGWLPILAAYHGLKWLLTFVFLAIYVLLALLFPRGIRRCGDVLANRPALTLLTTFLSLLALPLIFVLLIVTIIGIPVAGLVAFAIIACGLFGKAALFALIGRSLASDRLHPAGAVLLGGAVCALLNFVPILGSLISFFLSILGFGCAVTALLTLPWRQPPPVAPPPPAGPPPIKPPHAEHPSVEPAPDVPPAAAPSASSPPPTTTAAPPPVFGAASPVSSANAPILSSALPRAGFWIRMGAILLDALIIGIFAHVWFLAIAIYAAVMWKLKGTTVGGIVFGLRVVRLDDRPIEWEVAIVRALACYLSAIVFGLGFLWIAFDAEKQAWHDKIAGTVVVRTKGVSLV